MNKETLSNIAATLLLIIGSLAMFAEIFGLKKLKGIALATQCAPYTKVFGLAHGYENQQPFETFASNFTLHYTTPEGTRKDMALTPDIYCKLNGPYNRRNVYGAVLAYGPALPPDLRNHCLTEVLISENNISSELGIPDGSSDFSITISPKNPSLPREPFTLRPQ